MNDKVEATIVPSAQHQAFLRARVVVGRLHFLLNNAESAAMLAESEFQQLVADLGRDLQHLI